MQEKDFLEINKIHYENRIVDKYEIINRKIYEIAIKNDVKFLSKQEFLCDEVNKTCDGITKDGYKIFMTMVIIRWRVQSILGERYIIWVGLSLINYFISNLLV